MSNDKFNGWTNYETWRIALEFFDGYEIKDTQFKNTMELADHLKGVVEDTIEQEGKGIAADYALAFVAAVNYYEIAENLLNP